MASCCCAVSDGLKSPQGGTLYDHGVGFVLSSGRLRRGLRVENERKALLKISGDTRLLAPLRAEGPLLRSVGIARNLAELSVDASDMPPCRDVGTTGSVFCRLAQSGADSHSLEME